MCNPAEFFVDIMSKNTIISENNEHERKWFPSVLLEQILDDKIHEMHDELANKEMDLLVCKIVSFIRSKH